jgi:hypothetical protein
MRATCITLLLLLTGCAATVIPPSDPPDPVTVFLTDYGRHSSILLPAPDGALVEWAFGDFDFFARERWRWWDMIRVTFYSPRSTLGCRYVWLPSDVDTLRQELRLPRVQTITVSGPRATALLAQLKSRFEARQDTLIYGPTTELWFVEDPDSYTICSNCNHKTATWLRELGCEVRGWPLTSRFRVVSQDERSRGSRPVEGDSMQTTGSLRGTRSVLARIRERQEIAVCRQQAPDKHAGG